MGFRRTRAFPKGDGRALRRFRALPEPLREYAKRPEVRNVQTKMLSVFIATLIVRMTPGRGEACDDSASFPFVGLQAVASPCGSSRGRCEARPPSARRKRWSTRAPAPRPWMAGYLDDCAGHDHGRAAAVRCTRSAPLARGTFSHRN